MPKVEAPFVGAEVDTNDPAGSLRSIVMAVGGVGLLVTVWQFGDSLGDWMHSRVAAVTGVDQNNDGSSMFGNPE